MEYAFNNDAKALHLMKQLALKKDEVPNLVMKERLFKMININQEL
jgi:hypothetical protein